MAKEKETQEPVIVFSEAEVVEVVNFINACYKKASFNGTMEEMGKMREMFNAMHAHVKKIESYIFEHKTTSSKKVE
jgi:hypothetical protein